MLYHYTYITEYLWRILDEDDNAKGFSILDVEGNGDSDGDGGGNRNGDGNSDSDGDDNAKGFSILDVEGNTTYRMYHNPLHCKVRCGVLPTR
jgi:hypothetical protein